VGVRPPSRHQDYKRLMSEWPLRCERSFSLVAVLVAVGFSAYRLVLTQRSPLNDFLVSHLVGRFGIGKPAESLNQRVSGAK
jgi:hypothetical protein